MWISCMAALAVRQAGAVHVAAAVQLVRVMHLPGWTRQAWTRSSCTSQATGRTPAVTGSGNKESTLAHVECCVARA